MADVQPLTYTGLKIWLGLFPPDTNIGTAACAEDCPLAVFLRTHGFPAATVGAYDWEPDGCSTRDLPLWAQAFTEALDDEFEAPIEDLDPGLPVTAGDCLRILETIPDA